MREIKFRAWDVKRKSWMNEQDVYYEVQEQGRWNPERGQFYKLMQFTGLRDKNGKEIFDGDIVQWDGHEVQNDKKIHTIRKRAIGMTVDAFRNSFIDDCFHLQNLLIQGLNIEVIGNVHENPEMKVIFHKRLYEIVLLVLLIIFGCDVPVYALEHKNLLPSESEEIKESLPTGAELIKVVKRRTGIQIGSINELCFKLGKKYYIKKYEGPQAGYTVYEIDEETVEKYFSKSLDAFYLTNQLEKQKDWFFVKLLVLAIGIPSIMMITRLLYRRLILRVK